MEKVADKEYKDMILQNRKERAEYYNYNKIYKYNGGVPNKNSAFRGSAIGAPGDFHALHQEFEISGEDLETDFKVTRYDVELYTRSRRASKELLESPRSWFRPQVLESYSATQTFYTTYYYVLFVLAAFVSFHAVSYIHKSRRYMQEYKLKTGEYKMSDDGVVYKE